MARTGRSFPIQTRQRIYWPLAASGPATQNISLVGIQSGQAAGSHAIAPGAVTLTPVAIASAQVLGNPAITQTIASIGVPSDGVMVGVPARINQVTNPTFEADTPGNLGSIGGGWAYYGDSPTYKGIANDFGKYGSQSFKIQALAGNTDSGISITIPVPYGCTATLSAWVKTDASVVNASFVLDTSQGPGGNKTVSTSTGASADQRVSVTMTAVDANSVRLFIGLGSFGASSPGTVWWDGIMLEITNTNNAYLDGTDSAALGAYWESTTNNSRSILPGILASYTMALKSIASGEAVGNSGIAASISTIAAASIGSSEQAGYLSILATYPLSIIGIASVEQFGPPTITPGSVTISPGAIKSAEAAGNPSISALATILAQAIGSSEAFGAPSITTTYTVAPYGIASAERFGTVVVTPGAVTILPASIGPAEAFGAVSLAPVTILSPAGIGSAEKFGAPTITTLATISPAAIASLEAFGVATITPGVVTVAPTGIQSAERAGSHNISAVATIAPTGISSAQQLGAAVLSATYTILPVSIQSAERAGYGVVVPGAVTISPASIKSAEAIGQAILNASATISAVGIGSAEKVSAATVATSNIVAPAGIGGAEAFGAPLIQPGVATVVVASIAGTDAMGYPLVRIAVLPLSALPVPLRQAAHTAIMGGRETSPTMLGSRPRPTTLSSKNVSDIL